MTTPSIRALHWFSVALVLLVALIACAPAGAERTRGEQQRSTALDTRAATLREQRDAAALEAATADGQAQAATAAGRDQEARAHREAALIARARRDALADAMTRTEQAAREARGELHAAQEAADVAAAAAAVRASREWDRRACWWIGALCSGLGVVAAIIARGVGLSLVPGWAIVAGGLTVAAYGESAWLLLPLAACAAVAVAIGWLAQRRDHQVTERAKAIAVRGWHAAAERLPAAVRGELDRASLELQQGMPAVRDSLDRALDAVRGPR